MFERFRQLRMSQKFAFMVLVMGIPFIIAVNLLIGQSQGRVNTARNEMDGVDYLLAWRQPFQAVGQHRAATAAVLTGDGNFRATQLSVQALNREARPPFGFQISRRPRASGLAEHRLHLRNGFGDVVTRTRGRTSLGHAQAG